MRTYATKMFENGGRGIGDKGKDNGLLVLLALDDRQVWMEVGYDLEGVITDGFAGETSRQVMTPYFRQGQYGQGLLAGTSRVVARIAAGSQRVTVDGVEVRDVAGAHERPGVAPGRSSWSFVVLVDPAADPRRGGGRGGRRRGWRGRRRARGAAATMGELGRRVVVGRLVGRVRRIRRRAQRRRGRRRVVVTWRAVETRTGEHSCGRP